MHDYLPFFLKKMINTLFLVDRVFDFLKNLKIPG